MIGEGLGEIAAHFEFSGFSNGAEIETEEERPVTEDAESDTDSEEDDDSDDHGTDYFDREEIEVAIDAFISHLLSEKLIRKSNSGKLPSFSEVFEKFFGKGHEITAKAESFEDYIKGYFGWISPEDMRSAHGEFVEIQEIVEEAEKGDSDVAD